MIDKDGPMTGPRRVLTYVPLVVALLVAGCGGNVRPTASPTVDDRGAPASATADRGGETPPEELTIGATPPSATAPRPPAPTAPAVARTTPSAAPVATGATAATPAPSFDPARVGLALDPVATDLVQPLFVTHAGDGTRRLFVIEKGGTIRTLPDKRLFLDISDRVSSDSSEQGLLGLAFHPRFRQNGLFFVNYTARDGSSVTSRFSTTPNRHSGNPRSERVLIRQEDRAVNHNGGMLAFGPDGYLYIGLGDEGGGGDIFGNGQNPSTLWAKILRIDIDRGNPYAIPPDNPFLSDETFRPETWAYGLRNPWRFSFDRATGDLYIGDVGQNEYEYIHHQPAGKGGQNYGWPVVEGTHCFEVEGCDTTGLTLPVAEYSHDLGCSVTGGYVYQGRQYPALRGVYLFGDYCSGRIWSLFRDARGEWQMTEMLQQDIGLSSFGEDEAGAVYVTDLNGGTVYRLTATG